MIELKKPEPGKMIDASGDQVPLKWVPAYDQLRDRKVKQLVKLFDNERKRLEGCMDKALKIVEEISEARGAGIAERGNFQASSFDNLCRVEVVTRYRIELDDRALQAKQMMLDYVKEGLVDVKDAGHRELLLQLINDTFTSTNGKTLKAAMVIKLLNYKITAKRWREACDVLRSAMQSHRAKSYINVSVRDGHQAEWQTIKLDLADCWPEGIEM